MRKLREIAPIQEANFPKRPKLSPKDRAVGSAVIAGQLGTVAGTVASGGNFGIGAAAGVATGAAAYGLSKAAWKLKNAIKKKIGMRRIGWNEPSNIADLEAKRLAETPQLDTEIDRDWGYDSIQNAEIHYKQHKRKWRKVHDTPTHEIVARHLSNNGMFGDWDNSSAFAARNKKTGKIDIVTGGFYDSKNKRYQEHTVGARRGNKLKMPQLYSILLHTDTTREIQSDRTHSPGAKKSWKRLYAQNDDIQAGTLKGKRKKRLNLADFEKAYYGGKNIDKQISASRTRLTAKLKKKAKQ